MESISVRSTRPKSMQSNYAHTKPKLKSHTRTISREVSPEIGQALDRKTISNNYHSIAYPSFMYSNGPFRVYNHSQAKGTVQLVRRTIDAAQMRHELEVDSLANYRKQ